ncbi:MAG: hypothetical protein WCO12_04155 [bacterium]
MYYDTDEYFKNRIKEDNVKKIGNALLCIFPGTWEEKSAFEHTVMDKIKCDNKND